MSTPNELYSAAKNICNISTEPAMFRASISRLYYSSYHQCRHYYASLKALGSVGSANGIHEQLIAQLNNPGKLSQKERLKSIAVGKLLRALLVERVRADYQCDKVVDMSNMSDSLTMAEVIFSKTNLDLQEN